jgi:hypothetical protein
MKHLFKAITLALVINMLSSCSTDQSIKSFAGKYEYTELGMNETETRSYAIGYYLLVDSVDNTSTYAVAENSNFEESNKEVYTIKANGDELNLYFKSYIDVTSSMDQESKEAMNNEIGEKKFVFKKIENGLQMIWAETGSDNYILKKVNKFDQQIN